jgi:hypothetical protein
MRLATKAAPSKSAADVATTPHAIVVPMVLDRLEDKLPELRVALKNNRVLVAKEILTDIYDTEYAMQIRIDGLDQCEWGKRLDGLMKSAAALVEAEVARFPDKVGHVLGSIRQHRRQSRVARLISYLAWKGRDLLSNGALRRLKLMGQLRT